MQFLQNCIRPFFVCTSFCTFEGADNSDNGGNLAFMISSAEAIETAAVTTSNYDAGFGRAGGAMTNVTL